MNPAGVITVYSDPLKAESSDVTQLGLSFEVHELLGGRRWGYLIGWS